MPTYEYACDACGARFEQLQAMSDPPLTRCPRCGGAARRLISSGSVIVKGSDVSCALRTTGKTCCGRDERCGKPSCGA